MLMLKRRKDERIYIGDNIELKIVSVERKAVVIGIEAPTELNIVRAELIENPYVSKPPRKVPPT